MKYTNLGKTDIKVSKVCLGCMSFGKEGTMYDWTLNEDDTTKIIGHAIDCGINFFDTANQYSYGTSEEYLGNALRRLGVKREDVVIASKVFYNKGALSKEAILKEIDGTLSRLGTDYVDLYIMHRFDYTTPIEETMETLNSLVERGKVRALGASSMFGYQFYNFQMLAKEHNWARLEVMENHYNLLYREDEREMIPICKQMDVSLIPYSPLAAGHLTRDKWDGDSLRSANDNVADRRYNTTRDNDMKIVKRVKELSIKKNCSMSQIAMAWEYAKKIDAPIIGATKEKYIDDAIASLDIELNDDEVRYLEKEYVPHPLKGPLINTEFSIPQ